MDVQLVINKALGLAVEENTNIDYSLNGTNAVDVQLVINEALGFATGQDCDLNEDGSVDALDVQLVTNIALGII